ncbi:RNA pseudouridine synthase [Microvirga sp. BSC39]|uniref:RluA family pseudouridine synthase n=1 Tax=Microvirga sp. BSC39 TaxID=1549810 RepID=UPI0004E906B0|nr:RNA pseudouridine synthase [Microvirga sp. BSC39]KFG70736.1 pseudouridine synthase [Microvirga sp. BSC39]
MNAEEIVSRLLYRDALMLVIDKPAGLPVHPGPKGGETLFHHLDALRFGLPRRPEAAHRLDKDTSGCLILGRHPKAIARLNEMFRKGEIDKVYWAVVEGGPDGDEGEIDLPLAPKSPDRGWWMKVDPKGQPSLTQWRVLGRSHTSPSRGEVAPEAREGVGHSTSANVALPPHPSLTADPPPQGEDKKGLTLLELRPVTGRTHQLRVHCAASGFPILGDPIYGTAPRSGGPGLHLHARSVTVPLYPKKPPITVEAPVPAHMRERVEACGFIPDGAADPGSSAE